MKKTKISLLVICIALFLSCNKKINRQTIITGSTVKIIEEHQITEKNLEERNKTYMWFIAKSPENSEYMLRVNGNTALLTPDIIGEYDVFCSVRDEYDNELNLFEYYYIAEHDTLLDKIDIEVEVKPLDSDSSLILTMQEEKIKISQDTIIKINTMPDNKKIP